MDNKEKKRDLSCDYMKGILTILMILSHVRGVILGVGEFEQYVNLTTFSGLLFCSGYSSSLVYLNKEKAPVHKLLKGFFKMMLAYYISAFFCIVLCERNFSLDNLLQVILQTRLVGYSEFLVSWSYLYIVIMVFFPLIKKTIEKPIFLVVGVSVTLLLTMIPYEVLNVPWLGSLLGYRNNFCFPVLQYCSYFLVGAYLEKTKKVFSPIIFVVALIGTTIYEVLYRGYGFLPQRWGPDILFIVGGYLFVYLYFILCKLLEMKHINIPLLQHIGKHSLIFLIVSNIFVYCAILMKIKNLEGNPYLIFGGYTGITFLVCIIISYLLEINKEKIYKKRSK